MRIIFALFLLAISTLTQAKTSGNGCFRVLIKNTTQERCSPENFNFDQIQKKLEELLKEKVNNIRIMGHDGADVFYFTASVSREVKNFCQMEYDKIFLYDSTKNNIQELWNSENSVKEVFDNINHVRLVYLLNSQENPQYLHKCAPLVNLIRSKRINYNKGSIYNSLLNKDNFLVIHAGATAGIFVFDPKFQKIIGSLLVPEENQSIVDAEVSAEGTLVTILRDRSQNVSCLNEYDIESNVLLFKKCSSQTSNFAFLYKENDEVYVMLKSGIKSELMRSFNSFKPKIKEIKD